MKRPGVVWIYSLLVIVGVLFELLAGIGLLATTTWLGILKIILAIPTIIFIALFFMLKKSVLPWLYVAFGLALIINLVASNWIMAAVALILGWVVWDYVRNKQIDGQPVFT